MKKTVIIYGKGAIAFASAHALQKAEYNVVLFTDRQDSEMNLSDDSIPVCQIDPEDEDMIRKQLRSVEEEFGQIFGLFNAELSISRSPLNQITDETFLDSFRKNVLYFFHIARACALFMSRHKEGRIINLSSVHSKTADGYHLEYAATTAAVTALTRELAVSLWKDNIQVNTILAAFVDGQFDDSLDMDQHRSPERISLLGRRLTPDDIAKTVRFLISTETNCINGEEIRADAGYLTTQWRIGDTPFIKITDENIVI